MNVIYLCDKKACRFPQRCRIFGNSYECKHTLKPEHAKNDICLNPAEHPERFERIGEDYWEKE